jgi:6-phosphogluconolactonase
MMTERRVYPDKAAVALAAADYLLACYATAIAEHGRFALALAGGSTPRTLYELLVERPIDWTRVHIFWGDERTVPPDHPDSNYHMARSTLLNHVPLPSGNVYRIRTELEPQAAAAAYERDLRRFFGDAPRFDLILLGMGADGHTASLFPGTAALAETERWVVANHVPQLGTWRITFTLSVINAAAHVAFLVTGADKRERLQQVLAGPPGQFPAQLVQPADGEVIWFLDQAAVG